MIKPNGNPTRNWEKKNNQTYFASDVRIDERVVDNSATADSDAFEGAIEVDVRYADGSVGMKESWNEAYENENGTDIIHVNNERNGRTRYR